MKLLDLPEEILAKNLLPHIDGSTLPSFEGASRRCKVLVRDNLHNIKKTEKPIVFWWDDGVQLSINTGGTKKFSGFRILNPGEQSELPSIAKWREDKCIFMSKKAPQAPGAPAYEIIEVLGVGISKREILTHLMKKTLSRVTVKNIGTDDFSDVAYRMVAGIFKELKLPCEATICTLGATDTAAAPVASPPSVLQFLKSLNLKQLHIVNPIVKGSLKKQFFEELPGDDYDELTVGVLSQVNIRTEFDDSVLLGPKRFRNLLVHNCIVTPAAINTYLKQYRAGNREFESLDLLMRNVRANTEEAVWEIMTEGLNWANRETPLRIPKTDKYIKMQYLVFRHNVRACLVKFSTVPPRGIDPAHQKMLAKATIARLDHS